MYDFLMEFGYEMSLEEQQILHGTHELYVEVDDEEDINEDDVDIDDYGDME